MNELSYRLYNIQYRPPLAHMNILMTLDSVQLDHHTQDLRRLYDKVEANIRGLDALGIGSETY